MLSTDNISKLLISFYGTVILFYYLWCWLVIYVSLLFFITITFTPTVNRRTYNGAIILVLVVNEHGAINI